MATQQGPNGAIGSICSVAKEVRTAACLAGKYAVLACVAMGLARPYISSQSKGRKKYPQTVMFTETKPACCQRELMKQMKAGVRQLDICVHGIAVTLRRIDPGEFECIGVLTPISEKWPAATHRIKITKPFYIGVHEITQEVWAAVMGLKPPPSPQFLPQVFVNFQSVVEFCFRLSTAVGVDVRLPTEMQWEYAAAEHDLRYLSDAEIESFGWFKVESHGYIQPVGRKPANRNGLFDMLGNAAEYTRDLLPEHAPPRQSDPVGLLEEAWSNGGKWTENKIDPGKQYVGLMATRCTTLRGGGFTELPAEAKRKMRDIVRNWVRRDAGFRIVIEVP